ncbi:MAG TPA: Ig-like domain-containing protein, partial [Polyangiaceae bacterium]|nr:Ig-like domain-containing protein [Polyangiaceae bacterium]
MLGRNWLVPVTLGALIWSCSPRGELGLADSSSEDNGADGGGEPGSSASLHLESSTPGQDSSDADPNGPLELTFNAELEEGSLEAAEVTLTLDGRTVDGAATIDGTVLRFDPAEPLWLLGDYELKVGQQLRSADASLGEALTLRFRVRDGALRAVEPLVEPGSGYVGAPSIAVSANVAALHGPGRTLR